jgi:hypothetical protein
MTTIRIEKKGIEFESPHTDAEAIAICGTIKSDTFAQDLYNKRARLSAVQISWAHKLAVDSAQPPKQVATAASGQKIQAMLVKAASHLKYPKLTLKIGEQVVKFARTGETSKNPGSISITNGKGFRTPSSEWYGSIVNGQWTPGRDATPQIGAIVEKMEADPQAFVAEQGKASGNCCFCRKALTVQRSMTVGYGSTCAANYGLDY